MIQLPGEPLSAYQLFLLWLRAEPRPTPPSQLAAAWRWHERAVEYDTRMTLPPSAPERLRESLDMLTQLVYLGISKHVKMELQSTQPVLSLRDYLAAGQFLATGGKEIAERLPLTTQEPSHLLKKATVEELEAMLEMTDRLERR